MGSQFSCGTRYLQESFGVRVYYKYVQLSTLFLIATSSYHLLTLVSAFGVVVMLIFGETIITPPFAVYFSYRKDQHALIYIFQYVKFSLKIQLYLESTFHHLFSNLYYIKRYSDEERKIQHELRKIRTLSTDLWPDTD